MARHLPKTTASQLAELISQAASLGVSEAALLRAAKYDLHLDVLRLSDLSPDQMTRLLSELQSKQGDEKLQ